MEGSSSVGQEDWCFGDEVALIQQKKTKLEKICKLLTKKAPLKIRLLVKGMRRNGERGREKGYMRLEEEEGKTEREKMKTEAKRLSLNQWRTEEEWEIKETEERKRKRIDMVGEEGKKEKGKKEESWEMERGELMVDEIKVRDRERELEKKRESIQKLTVIQRRKKEMYEMERSGQRDVGRWQDWTRAQRESLKEKLSKKVEERMEGKRREKAGKKKERNREREDRTLKTYFKNVMQQMKEAYEKKKRDLQEGEQRERQRKTELKRVIQQQRQREEKRGDWEKDTNHEEWTESRESVQTGDMKKDQKRDEEKKVDLHTDETWADEEDTSERKQKYGEEKLRGEHKEAIKETDNIWKNFRSSWSNIGNSLAVIWARSGCNLQSAFFTLLQPSQADIGIHCHNNGNQCFPHYIACQRQSKAQTKYCNKVMKAYQRLQMQSHHPK